MDNFNIPPFTIGSIEGNGVVFLGAQNLTVGNNNLSTTFSGLMQDGPYFGFRRLADQNWEGKADSEQRKHL